jgi:hypothetical protein
MEIGGEYKTVSIKHRPTVSVFLEPCGIAKITLARNALGCRPLFPYPQVIMQGRGSETLLKN